MRRVLAVLSLSAALTAAAVPAAAESDQGCTQAYSSMYPGPNGETTGEGHFAHGESYQGRTCNNGWWVEDHPVLGPFVPEVGWTPAVG
ncbi:hypothetical protein [Nocardiopsis ganjiahuensis]|uniref:hypothetical protein n=1 Tax=Nocardiopsis ganjiahuensis TaxID=239984 RepID=UPI0003697DB3|nr:hypothetical protein [Nocardiopsis ganjiahuensis]